ncbi:MAG: murein hydrolase activator EnvC family protein [Gemmobacter sp.]
MTARAAARSLVLAAALLGAPAAAQDAAEPARRAAADLRAAVAAMQDTRQGRSQVAALSAAIAAYEAGLGTLREALRQATIRETALGLRLAAERERVARLLGVLSGLDQEPGPLLLLHPAGPLGMARSGMMLAEVTPALQAEVAALRAQLAELAALRSAQTEAAEALSRGLDAAQAARTALSQAIAARGDLPRRLTDDPATLAALVANARTLDAIAGGLAPTPPGDGPDFAAARGTLPLPVRGVVLRRAGEPDLAGIARPGIVLATRPEALVTAPWGGTIRYRGPLLDYGNVMLLETSPGYLLVLAGMATVFGEVGEIVAQGAPLGLMGGREALAPREGAGASETETLYMELRQDAAPIDPAPWFAETKG